MPTISEDTRGDAPDDSPWGHIVRDHRARGHHCVIADLNAIGDRGLGADPHVGADLDPT